MPPEPLHRSNFRPRPEAPGPRDRVADAIRGARLGAVLAAVVAILALILGGPRRLPFDPGYLVLAAFLAPIALALLRRGP